MAKIAFITSNTNFLGAIIDHLSKKHQVKIFNPKNEGELLDAHEWAEVSWFEWCEKLAFFGTQILPQKSKVIVRLHRYEAHTYWPYRMDWSRVDCLILVGNSAIRKLLASRIPGLESQTRVEDIANGVELDCFELGDKDYRKVAFVGPITNKKGIALLLQAISAIKKVFPEIRFYLRSEFQPGEKEIEEYFKYFVDSANLADSIILDQNKKDKSAMALWYKDKGFYLNTSIVEGCPVSPLEAAATGSIPLIHSWPGANKFFPPELIWSTTDQLFGMIAELPSMWPPLRVRQFVEESFISDKMVGKIDEILEEILRGESGKYYKRSPVDMTQIAVPEKKNERFENLQVGYNVKIKGKQGEEGVIKAFKIEIETSLNATSDESIIEGLIQGIDHESKKLCLANFAFELPDDIEIRSSEGNTVGVNSLQTNDNVKLKGVYSEAKGFLVKKIKMKKSGAFGLHELEGKISKIDQQNNIFQLFGFTVSVDSETIIYF
jgi:glycosyltransferase involved in cell wall biosynthesis